MTCGIYQIKNKINKKSYIGQSRNIEKRWTDHKCCRKKYPLYLAFEKYGIKNFDFSILEECSVEKLNEREKYYIEKEHPEYNQTEGGDYQIVPQKLADDKWKEIQNILINDVDGEISHVKLAQLYGVNKDTIRDINVGRTWHDSNLNYPLHISKFDPKRRHNEKSKCPICGEFKSKQSSKLCRKCYLNLLSKKRIKKEEQKERQRRDKEAKEKEKIKKAQERQRLKYFQIDKKTGEVINKFKNTNEAALFLVENNLASGKSLGGVRSHISEACNGKRKTAYGYKWRYIEQ